MLELLYCESKSYTDNYGVLKPFVAVHAWSQLMKFDYIYKVLVDDLDLNSPTIVTCSIAISNILQLMYSCPIL